MIIKRKLSLLLLTVILISFFSLPTATSKNVILPIVDLDAPTINFAQRFVFREDDTVRQLKPGILHMQRVAKGPIRVNLLLFDLTAPELNLKVALQNDWLSGVARTSTLAKANDAVAAVNGDLFSTNGLPQGMTMSDGKLALAPKRRATFAYSKQNGPFIGLFTQTFTWPSSVVAANGERHSLEVLNSICRPDWLCVYNDLYRELEASTSDVRVKIDQTGEVLAIRQNVAVAIAQGEQVLLGRGQAAKWLQNNLALGDKIELNMVTDPDYSSFEQIISGGPVFLRQYQFIQDCMCFLEDCSESRLKEVMCEEFTTDWKDSHYLTIRMPRNAVGYNADKTVLIVAVADGYQPGYSIGMTQRELSELFLEFGAESAMELDGGGSATMVVNNKVVSRPSDGSGNVERSVPDALVFQWNDENSTFETTPTATPTRQPTTTPTRRAVTIPTKAPTARPITQAPRPTQAPTPTLYPRTTR